MAETILTQATSDSFYTYKQVGAGSMVVMNVGQPIWVEIEYEDDDEQLYLMHITQNFTHKILTDFLSYYRVFVLK